jgi:hypothetical protein
MASLHRFCFSILGFFLAVFLLLAMIPVQARIQRTAAKEPPQAKELPPTDALAERLRDALRTAIGKNNYELLRSALPYLDISDFTRLRASLKVYRRGSVDITVLPIRPSGTGLICYLSIQPKVASEPTLQELVMVRSEEGSVAATRAVPLEEAAATFGISRHQAGIRILVEQQVTEVVETVTLEIRAPQQRRAFFLLSESVEQLSVSVGGGARYVLQNNFILIEADQPWPTGTKIHVELRYRRPLLPEEKKKG